MPDTLRLSSPNNSPKLSLRSTALFRTRTFLPTSTGSSATVLYHLILHRRMSKNPNIKERATASRDKLPDAILGYHLTLATTNTSSKKQKSFANKQKFPKKLYLCFKYTIRHNKRKRNKVSLLY